MKFHIEMEVDIDFDYTPETRGRFSGPPEDCYPTEPENLDVHGVVLTGKFFRVPADVTDKVDLRQIEDAIIDEVRDMWSSLREDALVTKYEWKQEEACGT